MVESINAIFPATRYQVYVMGGVLEPRVFSKTPNRRSVETLIKFNLLYTSVNNPLADFYIVAAGTDITDILVLPQFFNLAPVPLTASANLDEGDLEMYVTVADEKTILAGPIALTTTLGDVLEYIVYDNVDPAIVDLVAIPLP